MKALDAPIDRDAPDVLYIRKSAIERVLFFFSPRRTEFRVIVVTSSPVATTRFEDEKVPVTNETKSYSYRFSSEASATAFCEAIIAEGKG